MKLKITLNNGCFNARLHLLFVILSLCTITNAFNDTTREDKPLHVYQESTKMNSVASPSPDKIAINQGIQDVSQILGSDQLSITINGTRYNLNTTECSGGVVFQKPVEISELCSNQLVYALPSVCDPKKKEVILGSQDGPLCHCFSNISSAVFQSFTLSPNGPTPDSTVESMHLEIRTIKNSGVGPMHMGNCRPIINEPSEVSTSDGFNLNSGVEPEPIHLEKRKLDVNTTKPSAIFQSSTLSQNGSTPNSRVQPIQVENRSLIKGNPTLPSEVSSSGVLTTSVNGSNPNSRVQRTHKRNRTVKTTKVPEVSSRDVVTISVNGSTPNSRVELTGNSRPNTTKPSEVSSSDGPTPNSRVEPVPIRTLNLRPSEVSSKGVVTISANGSTPNSLVEPTHMGNPTSNTTAPSEVSSSDGSTPNSRVEPTHTGNRTLNTAGPSEIPSRDVVTISANRSTPNSQMEPMHMENRTLKVKTTEVSPSGVKSSEEEELEYEDYASEEEEDSDVAKNPDNYYYYYLKDDRTKKDPLKDDADTNGGSNEAIHSNALRKRETDNATKNRSSETFGRIGTIQMPESDVYGEAGEFIKETNVNINDSPFYDEFEERGDLFPENPKDTLDLRSLSVMTRKDGEYQGDYEMGEHESKISYDSYDGDRDSKSRYQATPSASPSLQEILVDVRTQIEQEIIHNSTSPNGQQGSVKLDQPVSQKWFFLLSAIATVADKLVPQILISRPTKSEPKVKPVSEPDLNSTNSTVPGHLDSHSGFLHDAKTLFSYFLRGLEDKDLGNANATEEDSELWKTIETNLRECAKRSEEINSTEQFTIVEKYDFGKPYVDFDTVQLKKPRWNDQNKNYTNENLIVNYAAFETTPESHLPPTEARINPENWLLAELMWYAVQLSHSFCSQYYPQDKSDTFTTTFDRLVKLFDSDAVQNLWRFPTTSLHSVPGDLQRTLIILDKVNWVVHEESTLHEWLTRPRKRVKKSIRKPHDTNTSPRLIAVMRPLTLTTQPPVVKNETPKTTAKPILQNETTKANTSETLIPVLHPMATKSPKLPVVRNETLATKTKTISQVEKTLAQKASSFGTNKTTTKSVAGTDSLPVVRNETLLTKVKTIPQVETADANTSQTPIPVLRLMTTELPIVRNEKLTTTTKTKPKIETSDANISQPVIPVLHPKTMSQLSVARNEAHTTTTTTIPHVETTVAQQMSSFGTNKTTANSKARTDSLLVVKNETITTTPKTIPKIETTVAQQKSSFGTVDTKARSEAKLDSVTTAKPISKIETTVAQQKFRLAIIETTAKSEARTDSLPVVRNKILRTTAKATPKMKTTVGQQISSSGTIDTTTPAKSEARTHSVITAKPIPKIETTVAKQKSSLGTIDTTTQAKSEARTESVKSFEIWDGLAFCLVRSPNNNELVPSLDDIKALGDVDCKT